jgi:PAS domain S-box-containing protein
MPEKLNTQTGLKQQAPPFYGSLALIVFATLCLVIGTEWINRNFNLSWSSWHPLTIITLASSALLAAWYVLHRHQQIYDALQESEKTYRTLFDSMGQGVLYLDHAGRITLANHAAAQILGAVAEHMIGKTVPGLGCRIIQPDGSTLPREMYASMIALATGQPTQAIKGIFNLRDSTYRWVKFYAIPLFEEQGTKPSEVLVTLIDITDLKQTEAALQHAKEDAELANRAKSDFLSRMSHELRTPLNAILGFGQLFDLEKLGANDRDNVQQITKAGRHLLALINEVLDITHIEAGCMALSLEAVAIRDVVNEVLGLMQPFAAERRVQLTNAIEDSPHVLADHQRLKQVLLNIVSNAIKYNRDEGTVVLKLETNGEVARLCVRDSGLGISFLDQQKLFTPFERLNAPERGEDGTGTGLALSQRLVELMGGKIGVESLVGEGSTFWVELPLTEEPLNMHSHVLEETLISPTLATARTPVGHVLYIEDNLSNLKLIERILLHRPGFHLTAAMQGSLGLDLAREHRPQLIFLDVHLPDMTGDEVLRRLQADRETRSIPVVVISADATPRQIERLLAAGASRYLTKPLDVKQILEILDTVSAGNGVPNNEEKSA